MAQRTTFVATTPFGTFRRTSAREYLFCVARIDGWHQFSQSKVAADREAAYQKGRGREVVVVDVTRENA